MAIRIPKSVADAAHLREGDQLDLIVAAPGAVELRSTRAKPSLAELVGTITPENRHGETNWGDAKGKEQI